VAEVPQQKQLRVVEVPKVLWWDMLTGQRFEERLQPLFLRCRKVEGSDLFRSAKERTGRVAASIVEVDYVIQRRCLAIAEVRGGTGNLPKGFRPPEAHRNGLLAETAVARGSGIVTVRSVNVEVTIGNSGIADKGLVGGAPSLSRVGVRRERGVDMETNDVKIVVGKQWRVMAPDAACLADEELDFASRLIASWSPAT
jgi:hypothetical protein